MVFSNIVVLKGKINKKIRTFCAKKSSLDLVLPIFQLLQPVVCTFRFIRNYTTVLYSRPWHVKNLITYSSVTVIMLSKLQQRSIRTTVQHCQWYSHNNKSNSITQCAIHLCVTVSNILNFIMARLAPCTLCFEEGRKRFGEKSNGHQCRGKQTTRKAKKSID